MNFIKKIFQDRLDDAVHSQFVRFSVGDYYPRAVMKIKSGSTTKLSSGFEYGNDFVRFIGENTSGEVEVKGKIFAKFDFDADLVESKEKKKGFVVGIIDRKMSAKELIKLCDMFKTDYLLLSIKGKDFELKMGSAPYNPKGSYKEDFCKFSASGELAKKAIAEFAFDIGKEFKELMLKHRFLIDDIEIPKEFEKDMAMARIMAKRVGKVVRELGYDGKEEKKETRLRA